MKSFKSCVGSRALPGLFAGAMFLAMTCAVYASAQSAETIEAGTNITVRTNGQINSSNSDGRIFSGVVEQEVVDKRGRVAIPRGAAVELVVTTVANNQVALDLESVTVDGRRYGIDALDSVVAVTTEQEDGVGANSRTGRFVGGGAVIGAIIGAVTGGGKGAAIGGGVGAAAGAGAQVLTRGKSVNIPAESLVTFRLEQSLRTGVEDYGFNRNGAHYHPGYTMNPGNTAAYQDGLQTGRSDWDRQLVRNVRSTRWTSVQQVSDYRAGYSYGYDEKTNNAPQAYGDIRIGENNIISWRGSPNSRVFVQMDGNSRQLFATGGEGSQRAPWITPGHLYVFVLQDVNGNEVARDESDLRPRSRGRAPVRR